MRTVSREQWESNRRAVSAALALIAVLGAQRTSMAAQPVRLNSVRASPVTVTSAAPASATTDERAKAIAVLLQRALTARGLARGAAATAPTTKVTTARPTDGRLEVWWREDSGTPRHIRVHDQPALSGTGAGDDEGAARAFVRAHRQLLELDSPNTELQIERAERDHLGRRHVRFQQRYRGLPVWPAGLTVHLDSNGSVDLLDGAYVPTPRDVGLQPSISPTEATERGRFAAHGGSAATATEPILIVYAPGDRAPRLAWKLTLSVSWRSRWLVVIDALTGDTLTAFDEVMQEGVAGSGEDANGDSRPLNAWREDGLLYLVDTSKPMFDPSSDPPEPTTTRGGIVVLDARNQPPTSEPQEFPELFYVTATTPTAWTVPDAVSASFGLSEVYDYFLEHHGRNSLDGAGGSMMGVVRYGSGFQNAFWNGSFMTFGNGDNYAGTLDIVAHELTHGVTQYTANLVYRDQPGALNESLSDIFGEAVEARTFGATDWVHGSQTSSPDRNLADPGSRAICDGCPPYPARFSEFYGPDDSTLDRFQNRDNGGVHINSGIINHAFYLLADGLSGAIGIRQAEQIVYRAQSQHLLANSQFIDARLAWIAAARELFGAGSAQEQRTAAAFDAVEIFDGRGTPVPPPFPGVDGGDATLFLFWDPTVESYFIGRQESAQGDPAEGVQLIGTSVTGSRPAVTGDGRVAVFVNTVNDVCLVNTDGSPIETEGEAVEVCLGFPGFVSSVAVSPDGNQFGFVFLDSFGNPDNRISVIDLAEGGETRTFTLFAPAFDGGVIDSVVNASTMDFTADGRYLIYDALNAIELFNGSTVEAWSIYSLDLMTETILPLVPPVPGLDIANPALTQTSDNFLVFDVYDGETGDSTIVAGNLTTGASSEIGTVFGGLGVPGYSGDDTAIVYSQSSDAPTEFSLVRQRIGADRLTPQGRPSDLLSNADFGVIYRRGQFVGPGVCAGDCNSDGVVTVDEIITGVTLALSGGNTASCRAIDVNGDGRVTVEELVQAITVALNGC